MDDAPQHEVTALLLAWRRGEEEALAELIPRVYVRLKRLASSFLRNERLGHTLQTTALVNELYLRLIELERISWQDRAHFFAMCSRMIRRILVDHARRGRRQKRGGDMLKISLEELSDVPALVEVPELLRLDEALHALAERDPEAAKIVELRYFGGLNRNEIAEVIGASTATVTRRWRMARAWLLYTLSEQDEPLSREEP